MKRATSFSNDSNRKIQFLTIAMHIISLVFFLIILYDLLDGDISKILIVEKTNFLSKRALQLIGLHVFGDVFGIILIVIFYSKSLFSAYLVIIYELIFLFLVLFFYSFGFSVVVAFIAGLLIYGVLRPNQKND